MKDIDGIDYKEIQTLKEVYKIKTPRNIYIGDPMYFEGINEGDNRLKKFCAIVPTIPRTRVSSLVFEISHISYKDGLEFDSIVAKIYIAPEQKTLDVYLNGLYYKNSIKSDKDLGCDTACYDISIDDRSDTIHTGADGYYGRHITYKDTLGHRIEITFPDDLMDIKEVRRELAYLFDLPEIKKDCEDK